MMCTRYHREPHTLIRRNRVGARLRCHDATHLRPNQQRWNLDARNRRWDVEAVAAEETLTIEFQRVAAVTHLFETVLGDSDEYRGIDIALVRHQRKRVVAVARSG